MSIFPITFLPPFRPHTAVIPITVTVTVTVTVAVFITEYGLRYRQEGTVRRPCHCPFPVCLFGLCARVSLALSLCYTCGKGQFAETWQNSVHIFVAIHLGDQLSQYPSRRYRSSHRDDVWGIWMVCARLLPAQRRRLRVSHSVRAFSLTRVERRVADMSGTVRRSTEPSRLR